MKKQRYEVQVIDDSVKGDKYLYTDAGIRAFNEKQDCIDKASSLNRIASMIYPEMRYRVYDTKFKKVIYSIPKR